MTISQVVERENVILYLKERKLLKQYKKAKIYLLSGLFNLVKFKQKTKKR